MYRFFINRPIVAMVIAILQVVVGLVTMLSLPVAQYPNIVPPEIRIQTTYVGADAQTLAESVATPIEEQMSGVDNMNYMYSVSANNGVMRMGVNFDVKTDPNIDQVLSQLRENQAEPQLPADVRNFGITLIKSPTTPLMLVALTSPKGTHDSTFLANYAYINLVDQVTQLKGISTVTVFGAGQYAMRFWVKPDQLAKLNITINDLVNAINAQNTVNPAGQVGGPPTPKGQEFTYTITAQSRLVTEKEFENIVVRENSDGSVVRLKDVARIELGAQTYSLVGKLNGKPSAVMAIYQLPGSNAIDAANNVKNLMKELKARFPSDLEYGISLDTTRAVSEGMREIRWTLGIALVLVIIVVFIFLQGWRASLIPLVAVPVSLIGTFAFFPLFGFSLNTLSLLGLVLAIGLVVDDAIVVVEATERHIEEGLNPKEAAIKAMDEVSAPVVALALILAAVFVPTVFIAGITGRLYQQFAVTIAISVALSAFNALSLSPALAALLLRPKQEGKARGPLGGFYDWFNRNFEKTRHLYLGVSLWFIRKAAWVLVSLLLVGLAAAFLARRLPTAFVPEEDQGYAFAVAQLPFASSLERTDAVAKKIENIVKQISGVEYYTTVEGFSLLSQVQATYNVFFFVTLKEWTERTKASERFDSIKKRLNDEMGKLPEAQAFAFSPPSIPGIGTAGGFTFMLEDRSGSQDVSYLTENLEKFLAAAKKRPELSGLITTHLPNVPQIFVQVDRDKVLKQGVSLSDVYRTLQTFMGGNFVNYFNRFGRQWQVYIEAEDKYRASVDNLGLFYVRNNRGQSLPLTAFAKAERRTGPEFVMHYNEYPCAQINGAAAPPYSSDQANRALEEVFAQTMPKLMGYDYFGMSFQEKKAADWDLYVSSADWIRNSVNKWDNNSFHLFVQLDDHADIDAVSRKIAGFKQANVAPEDKKINTVLFLFPMADWHLRSHWEDGRQTGGLIEYVRLFGTVGLFVLLLACINFMNLSTARSERRAKEVGIRKSIGSLRSQLIGQFYSESLLVVILAFALSLGLVQIILPWFNQVADKNMIMPWRNPVFWLLGLAFTVITAIIAGSYPALYLSSFRPVKVLKGAFKVGRLAAIPRKALVVLQFTISITLIIGTIVVYRQILFSRDRPIGYDRDRLMMVTMKSHDYYGKFDVLRDELKKTGAIAEMAESSSPMTEVWATNDGFEWPGYDPNVDADFGTIWVTHEYGKTIGWTISQGRDFSRELGFRTDSASTIVNEAAVKYMGLKNPVGTRIKWGSGPGALQLTIIGVAKNMLMESPYDNVRPTFYFMDYENANWMLFRLNPNSSAHESVAKIGAAFKKILPAVPFDYLFADNEYTAKFAAEERIGKLAVFFTVLAVFISCIGLFGLASFVAEQRTREIGIRKVLGASVTNLWGMLSKDFIQLVAIACVISIPVGWYVMHGWLQNYPYRTSITWWIFAITGCGALLLTLLTVSWQAIRAALANPVENLRSE